MTYSVDGLDRDRVRVAPDGLTPYSWRGPCRIGDCSNPATDPHHIVPRGRLGVAARWLVIDGVPIANVAGICRLHHDRITDGRSLIVWRDAPADPEGWWYQSASRLVALRPLGAVEAVVAGGGRRCPHCGQVPPRPRPYELHRRERKAYTIAAPTDQGEDGVAILESLTEQVAERIGLERPASAGAAYYAVTTALAAVLTNERALDGLRERIA